MAGPASHRAAVEEAAARGDEPTAAYEVRLQGTLSAGLRQKLHASPVETTGTETVLYLQVERPAELDALLAHILSLGLVPTEVQPCVEADRSAAANGEGRSPW